MANGGKRVSPDGPRTARPVLAVALVLLRRIVMWWVLIMVVVHLSGHVVTL